MKNIFSRATAAILVCLLHAHMAFAQPVAPIKGAWLTNVASDLLNSKAGIRQAVALAKQSGLTHICTVVWNRGYTQYRSPVMGKYFGVEIDPAYPGRDPLQELVEEAHRQGIKVIAWFEFGFSAAYGNEGRHILEKYPHWAARDVQGRVLVENGFTWMNSFHPEVQAFIMQLVEEVVKNYDVDGIQGDDRLPAAPSRGGYDAYTTSLYKQAHNGAFPPSDYLESHWLDWRTDLITEFGREMYRRVKAIKPNMLVAHAPSIYPWSKEHYLQDWPRWLREGITDVVMPQVYRYSLEAYQKTLEEAVRQAGPKADRLFPGVLTALGDGFLVKDELLKSFIETNRRLGLRGEVFFYFECLRRSPDFYRKIYPTLQ